MGTALWSLAEALRRRAGFGVPVLLLAALLATPGMRYAIARTQARSLPPVTLVGREAFIEKTYPTYPLYRWIESAGGATPRVYAWRDSPLAYYAPGTFLGDWFGPARYSRIECALPSASALGDSLDALGVAYFVVPWELGPVALSEDSLRQKGIVFVHAGEGGRVFRVVPLPGSRPIDLGLAQPR
jgi:hypothetical protein